MNNRFLQILKNKINYIYYIIREAYSIIFMKEPQIMNVDETVDYILKNHCSISRNGDGEIFIMTGQDIDFQKYDPKLASIMKEAIKYNSKNYLPCIIDVFSRAKIKNSKYKQYYINHLIKYRYFWYKFSTAPVYGNASITRFYNGHEKAVAEKRLKKLKRIWDDLNILIIEGEMSRLGVGNDLFKNAKSIKRIIAPKVNAFDKYYELKKSALKNYRRGDLILLALGPTASALSYELSKEGCWAIDIGHIDIVYEWMLLGATDRVNIPGKYTNEAKGEPCVGNISQNFMTEYNNQIIERII